MKSSHFLYIAILAGLAIALAVRNRDRVPQNGQPVSEVPASVVEPDATTKSIFLEDSAEIPNQQFSNANIAIDLDDTGQLFFDATNEAPDDLIDRADSFYDNPKTPVPADRYRFIHVDYDLLHRQLEQTPAYLAEIVGRSPPPLYEGSEVSFSLTLFNDRQIELFVTNVRLSGDPGQRYIVIRGEVAGGGNFRLSTVEGRNTLQGTIETQEMYTRIDTFKGASVTIIAEFDRKRIESANIKID